MPRVRALLAILLAVTWCSAAWHVDLEALDLVLEHQHHSPDHDAEHAPAGASHDNHEEVFARDVAKDQVRIGSSAMLWFTVLGLAVWLSAAFRSDGACSGIPRQRRETGPPLARIWQFVQRCAPQSVAPPPLR